MTEYENLCDSCLSNMKNYLFEESISDLIKISKIENLLYHKNNNLLFNIFQIQSNTHKINLFLAYCTYIENDFAIVQAFKIFDLNIIEHLINNKYDLNVKNEYNETPLTEMIKRKEVDIVKNMIDSGASVSFPGDLDNCPLNYAVDMDSLTIMELLISKGADIHQKNAINDSVLMRSLRGNMLDPIGFLLKYNIELALNESHENGVSVALDQAKFGSGYEEAAIMVLTQAAIQYPNEIKSFKQLSGFELIKEKITPILSSIELQLKMNNDFKDKPEKINTSSKLKL